MNGNDSVGGGICWLSGESANRLCRHGALYIEIVEAAKGNGQDQLDEDIREHVAECFECKVEVMEVPELIDARRGCGFGTWRL